MRVLLQHRSRSVSPRASSRGPQPDRLEPPLAAPEPGNIRASCPPLWRAAPRHGVGEQTTSEPEPRPVRARVAPPAPPRSVARRRVEAGPPRPRAEAGVVRS